MDHVQLSAIIKEKCKQKGKTIKSLREHAGVSHTFFYDLEKKGYSPSFETMVKIADYLECTLDELLNRTDKPDINR